MCLHNIYITIVVITNEIIAVTNRINVYSIIIEKGIFVWHNNNDLNHYYYAILVNQKFPFYTETDEQSLSMKQIINKYFSRSKY